MEKGSEREETEKEKCRKTETLKDRDSEKRKPAMMKGSTHHFQSTCFYRARLILCVAEPRARPALCDHARK